MTIESTNVTGLSETCPVPDEQEVLEYASWLTTDILLLVGRFAEPVEAVYLDGAGATRLDVRCLSYSSPDDGREGEAPAEPAKALLLRFPGPVGGPRFEGGLELKVGGASHPLDATELRRVTVDLQSLLREAFAPLPSPARADVVAFLASALEGAAESLRTLQLCGRLFVAREALRERPPWALAGAAGSGGLRVESLLALDERAFFVSGSMGLLDPEVVRLTAVAPEGGRADLSPALLPPEPDAPARAPLQPPRTGFLACFELTAPSYLPRGWLVETLDVDGTLGASDAPDVVRDPDAVRDRLLGAFALARPALAGAPAGSRGRARASCDHIHPALARLQKRVAAAARVADVVQLGTPASSPGVSIIVPLPRGTDRLEHQLTAFAGDPELFGADLIYVLPDPAGADRAAAASAHLAELCRLPFRLVLLNGKAGACVAQGAAVSLVRAPLLLFLDPDVLPDGPGWLGRLIAFHASCPGVGAVGPRLVYEDDAVHHAGVSFARAPGGGPWRCRHRLRGLHRLFPGANEARPVPAVGRSCLLLGADLYERVGGLRHAYPDEDFEVADLCLRLLAAGRRNWYFPAAELRYLSDPAPPGEAEGLAADYSAWLLTHDRGPQIEALADPDGPAEHDPNGEERNPDERR